MQAGANDVAARVPTSETILNLRRAVQQASDLTTVVLDTVPTVRGRSTSELNAAIRNLAREVGAEVLEMGEVIDRPGLFIRRASPNQ